MLSPSGFSLTDLITLVVTLVTGTAVIVRALLSIRDQLKELRTAIGTSDPRAGLLGKVADLEEAHEAQRREQQQQREQLLLLGMDTRSGLERRQRDLVRVKPR